MSSPPQPIVDLLHAMSGLEQSRRLVEQPAATAIAS